jgi:hypothetical protein
MGESSGINKTRCNRDCKMVTQSGWRLETFTFLSVIADQHAECCRNVEHRLSHQDFRFRSTLNLCLHAGLRTMRFVLFVYNSCVKTHIAYSSIIALLKNSRDGMRIHSQLLEAGMHTPDGRSSAAYPLPVHWKRGMRVSFANEDTGAITTSGTRICLVLGYGAGLLDTASKTSGAQKRPETFKNIL